jgi:hypothetical protein
MSKILNIIVSELTQNMEHDYVSQNLHYNWNSELLRGFLVAYKVVIITDTSDT